MLCRTYLEKLNMYNDYDLFDDWRNDWLKHLEESDPVAFMKWQEKLGLLED